MKAFQKVDGSVLLSCREYDIAPATAITPGQVVSIAEGRVIAAKAAQTAAILGIAAEAHSGVVDALNPRSNGTKILVYDDPDLVSACKAPEHAATGGTATTVVIGGLAAFSADDFNGGWLKLVSKAEGSTNTDAIGTMKRIKDFAISDGTGTFTVESGATAAAGDVFAIYPPVGFSKGNLDATGHALVLTATAALAIKVIGNKGGDIMLMAKKHILGAGE